MPLDSFQGLKSEAVLTEKQVLEGVTVAIPESRQRDMLAAMLQARGAVVRQIPLVAIHDNPDVAVVLAWLRAFIASPPDILVLLTGEGLRRLLALAQQHGLQADFVSALQQVCKLCRGPKPERVLLELAQKADISAAAPTTEGVITSLAGMTLTGKVVAVQLYGEEPNRRLIDFLQDAGCRVRSVSPYIYASKEEEQTVVEFLQVLALGDIDVLAFTSQSQYRRLLQVARDNALENLLRQGMQRTVVAAVGPVVRDQLLEAGYKVEIMPERVYFMKPLVAAIERYFSGLAQK